MNKRSVEEEVETIIKDELRSYGLKIYFKTEPMDRKIDEALKISPSKQGGSGGNYPDIKLFAKLKNKKIPVMIEVKGKKNQLIKLNSKNEVDNIKKDGKFNYINISRYALNGAVHYAESILKYAKNYEECIAIGVNGYYEVNILKKELEVYYISKDNFFVAKRVGDFSDLSFLSETYIQKFIEKIDNLNLTEQEIEEKTKSFENEIEVRLKKLNQEMEDNLSIDVHIRVKLIVGLIMVALFEKATLTPENLEGNLNKGFRDGELLFARIKAFLNEKDLPIEKIEMIENDLESVFVHSDLSKPFIYENGVISQDSKLKIIYTVIVEDIIPIFTSAKHLDFTGKLFNILNEWVHIPDGDKNDVVLTPRYVTELMARLTRVNRDSYVWDYALGSGGFLISAMKLMIKDAEENIKSYEEVNKKILKIKSEQLLGIEKRTDIYLLAVLNMILMGDGTSNILNKDSLEYDGTYQQGEKLGDHFPADVFLLNPPYSTEGKGFIFAEKALKKMKNGYAAILIQENAGAGKGLPYTGRILEKNTLLASIRMGDIFKGKAGVQTAIYLFEVGKAHNVNGIVRFIDFSNDGYERKYRKKSTQEVNLRDKNNASERYEELVNLVLYGKEYLKFFTEEEYIEDRITLNGDDWTFLQHKKFNTIPKEEDFKNTVKEYLSWEISQIINEEEILGKLKTLI